MKFIIFATICTMIAYPFWGAVLYADPWKWIFKE